MFRNKKQPNCAVNNQPEVKGSADMHTNTTGRSWKRRLTAAIGVIGLSMAGLVGFAGTANAAPSTTAPWAEGAPTTGSLTLHKIAGATGDSHDGTELTMPEGTEFLEGVEFTATQVLSKGAGDDKLDFTLSTGAGWTNMDDAGVIDDIDNIAAGTGYTFGTPTTATTDSNGAASFESLPLGLYLIQETDSGENNTVAPIEPFLVTIPLNLQDNTGAATGEWLYDVHAYPKNSVVGPPVKSVTDPTSNLNGSQTWSITQPIPTMNTGETIDSFSITDQLDSRLVFTAGSASVTLDGTAMSATTDYTLTPPTAQNDNTLGIVFTAAGLTAINAAQGKNLVLSFDTTTNAAGIIDNDAVVNINGADVTTNKPSTLWGGIEIVKQDGNDTAVKLAGAKFEVYNSNAAGTAPAGTALSEVETGSDGKATFGQLWVSNSTATTSRDYWIVETVAAPGYVLDSTPRKVTVTANANGIYTVATVNNYPPIIPGLPLTGSAGTMVIMGIGLAFLATAAGLITVARKRRN